MKSRNDADFGQKQINSKDFSRKTNPMWYKILFLSAFLSASALAEPKAQDADAEREGCRYFLTMGLENDVGLLTLRSSDNDTGYTHGHLNDISRLCESGEDIVISMDSRFFIQEVPWLIQIEEDGGIITGLKFEEENRLSLEYTDWRKFKKYYRVRAIIGRLSRDKLLLAGREHKFVHENFGKAPERLSPNGHIVQNQSNIYRHFYIKEPENKTFFGTLFAFGKSYSLKNLDRPCDPLCLDYLLAEAGMELVSLEKGSYMYMSSKVNKTLPFSILWGAVPGITAFVKVQNNGGDFYGSAGTGFYLTYQPGIQIRYLLKGRKLPSEEDRALIYDDDEERLFLLEFTLRF